MIEQALGLQKEVYLCLIDYTDAFDKVHDDIITQLIELKIDGKDPTVIKKPEKVRRNSCTRLHRKTW